MKKSIKFRSVIPPEARKKFIGDAVRLRQIMANLISNSVKYTDTGTITVRMSISKSTNESSLLRVTVRDTGIGIPPHHLGRIFEPFFRSHNASSGRPDSTGLGLYICKRLVTRMGGRMRLASALNKGTIVGFTLPLQDMADTELEAQRIVHPELTAPIVVGIRPTYNWNILFAEDNRINRIVGEEYLKKYGCKLIFAENGEQAVEEFKRGRFDMVLMDCQMPEMDGLDATRAIRMFERENGRSPMPIVAVTAHASEQSRLECIDAGMNDYVCKPYTEDALLSVLRKWSAAA